MLHGARRILRIAAAGLLMGCSSKVVSQASPQQDATEPPDVYVADSWILPEDTYKDTFEAAAAAESSIESDVVDAPSPAAACDPITGTAPFAVRLAGEGTATTEAGVPLDATVSATVDLYFPSGRVAGGEVVIVGPTAIGRSVVRYGTLDATLSARGLSVSDPACWSGVTGDLIGPTGGLDALVGVNRGAPGSDLIDLIHGRLTMCRAGVVPEQKAEPPPASIYPFRGFSIRGARPFSRASFASVTATAGAAAVPIVVGTADPGVTIAPMAAPFPLTTPTAIELSGLRDVLGAPLGFTSTTTLVTTATITDLTFAAPLPTGAYLGTTPEVASGRLRIGIASGSDSGGAAAWETVLAIGSSAGKPIVRIRHRLDCGGSSSGYAFVSIVSGDGKRVDAKPSCAASPIDEKVAVPGTGPFFLVASVPGTSVAPCSYPIGKVPVAAYEVDEIAFE